MTPQLYFFGFLLCLYAPYFVWAMLALLSLAEDRAWDEPHSEPAQGWPLVTVAVPIYNEGDQFIACIHAMLSIEYPNLEVIVVNDGSSDHSFDVARERYGVSPIPSQTIWPDRGQPLTEVYKSERYPHLHIYNQPNGGKAGALNTALRFAKGKYFLTLDADSIPGRFSLKRLVMSLERQPQLVGASGIVRLGNGCTVENGEIQQVRLAKPWLLRFQTLEYLRAFLIARIGMSVSGGLIILSGAFSMLRTDKLRAVGGFDQRSMGEDFEICLRLLSQATAGEGPRLAIVPNANCWTTAPETLRVLYRQRERWQRGCFETLWTHRHLFLSWRQFRLSWLCLPAFLFFEALTPIYELGGYIFMLTMVLCFQMDWRLVWMIFLSVVAINVVSSLIALLSETIRPGKPAQPREVFTLMLAAVLEPLIYRPFNALPRITGTFKFLFIQKQVWGNMERSKLTAPQGK